MQFEPVKVWLSLLSIFYPWKTSSLILVFYLQTSSKYFKFCPAWFEHSVGKRQRCVMMERTHKNHTHKQTHNPRIASKTWTQFNHKGDYWPGTHLVKIFAYSWTSEAPPPSLSVLWSYSNCRPPYLNLTNASTLLPHDLLPHLQTPHPSALQYRGRVFCFHVSRH